MRAVGVILGILLLVAGIPLTISPIPVGILLVGLGVLVLAASSPPFARWLKRMRAKRRSVNDVVAKAEEILPEPLAKPLERTKPGTGDAEADEGPDGDPGGDPGADAPPVRRMRTGEAPYRKPRRL